MSKYLDFSQFGDSLTFLLWRGQKKLFDMNHPWYIPYRWFKFDENYMYHKGSLHVAL